MAHQASSSTSHATRGSLKAGASKLSRWLKGPDTVMALDVDPDAFEEAKRSWEQWRREYLVDLPADSPENKNGMGRAELRKLGDFLEGDFDRIRNNIPTLRNDTNDPQVVAGLSLLGEVLDNCQADLVTVMTAAKEPTADSTTSDFQIPVEQLKTVERSHMLALSCISKIIIIKQRQALRLQNRISTTSARSKSAEADSLKGSRYSQNMVSEDEEETANNVEMVPINASESMPSDSGNLPRGTPANINRIIFRPNDIGSGRPLGTRSNQAEHNVNPMTEVSSSSSHMKNLTALLGIAFFGASITWSTVFSGTRGDLVLISWSACLFIVGAVGAATASMLVLPEEDIVAKHDTVRWTVRILSLLAILHVLAGMFLVALAILALDPTQQSPQARAGRRGVQSAGGYAVAASVLFIAVSGIVWRRYTARTWFKR